MKISARVLGLLLLGLGCLIAGVGVYKLRPDRPPPKSDPTVQKVAQPSKSLELAEVWTPPEATRTAPAARKARVERPEQYGVPSRPVSELPSEAELQGLPFLPEPLMPVPGRSSDEEVEALGAALREYQAAHSAEYTAPLERFVETHPESRWVPSLLLNMGSIAYETGYFQDALRHWKRSWELAKGGTDLASQQVANRAIAEYAKMNARVGRADELDAVFAEVQGRNFMGDARVKLENSLEGRWVMKNKPGVAFRCGPYALTNIAPLLSPEAASRTTEFLQRVQSPTTGFSLSEVQEMSRELGLELQMAKRVPGSSIIVPAVVHWKVGHFGALTRELDGKYLLQDPTFGSELWVSQTALDQEASGYFLVPAGPLPSGWEPAPEEEARAIYGKGHSGNTDPDETGPDDDKTPDQCPGSPNLAMATYSFHLLLASLSVVDTPVGYTSSIGPEVRLQVTYNQREAAQPATLNFTNFSPQWVNNWVSYLEDNPSSPGATIKLRKRGGGGEVHKGFNSTTQTYALQSKNASVLHRLSSNTYKKVYSDGSEEFYEHYIGTTGTQRKVFLSRIKDPQGNQISIEYDTTYPTRISRIIDAAGLPTVYAYDYPGQPYLVTAVEDPFGRTASFTYTPSGGVLRLQSIEDVYGIVSSFTYNTAGEIVALTTPYGTTTFTLSPLNVGGGYSLIRYAEATDPYGSKERVEYNTSTTATGISGTLETPRPDSALVSFTTGDNDDRNSFYWDKQRMKLGAGDYSKAHLYHWIQPTAADVAMSILESEKPPLESRIYYNYPGQTNPSIQGTLAAPSVIARVVKDAQGVNHTQASRYQYNAHGQLTKMIDPVGRETVFEYAPNGVDVLLVKQKAGESGGQPVWETLASYTYEAGTPPHKPTTVTDGAGRTTRYTYSPSGQVRTIENANGNVVTLTYETDPTKPGYDRLISITGSSPDGNRSFTYDSHDRVRTVTDADGYTLTIDYDSLDRTRLVTHPDGTFEQFEYDDHSLVASRDREGRWTRHQYNKLRERVLTRDPAQQVTQFQWCRCGLLRRLVDGAGNITEWDRDEQGRLARKTYADGSFTTYGYDFSGRLVTQVDPMGRLKKYEYTLDDRVAKVDYSDTTTPDITFTYDPWFGRIKSRVDGIGTTTYGYQPYNGATPGAGQVAYIDGPFPDDTLKHTYDALGKLQKMEIVDDATRSVASYSEAYTFDARDRLTRIDNGLGAITYGYVGQSDRPSVVDFPNGAQTTYDYHQVEGDLLLKQIKHLTSGPASRSVISQFDYTYNEDGTIDTWSIGRGQAGTTTWTFGYDEARQLTEGKRRDASQTLLQSERYGYDEAGNRNQVVTGEADTSNFETSNLNQLVSERGFGPTRFEGSLDEPAAVTVNGQPAKVTSSNGGPPYTFEASVDLPEGTSNVVVSARDGNNNSASRTYGVTTEGVKAQYEYDANGNLRFEREPDGTVLREYHWDQANRLVRVVNGARESLFEYDGESRRVRITERENGVTKQSHVFMWCGTQLCQKRIGSTVDRTYYEDGFQDSSGSHFYTRDHLGSVWDVVASDGATVESRLRYGPWGNLEEETGTVRTDFAYTGHYLDRASGLSLAQFRAYDPNLGRWLSRDPMFDSDETGQLATRLPGEAANLHGYARNNPMLYRDPNGEAAVIAIPLLPAVGAGLALYAMYCTATGTCPWNPGAPPLRLPPIRWPSPADPPAEKCSPRAPPIPIPMDPPAPEADKKCPPCPPPPPSRIDRVPPSASHYPCPGDHMHTFKYNQNPKTCQCFPGKDEVICLP